MKIIDISWPITDNITAYKDRKTVQITKVKHFDSDNVRESKITLGMHTGTHVDAPSHFLKDGSNDIDINKLVGSCKVLDFTEIQDCITASDLEKHDINDNDIVLFKTKNSLLGSQALFTKDFIYLEKTGAQYLAKKNIKAVGTDFLGIERGQPNHETHILLLEKQIPIIEGLRLDKVDAGCYMLYCLPLKIIGVEAAPARAVLIQ